MFQRTVRWYTLARFAADTTQLKPEISMNLYYVRLLMHILVNNGQEMNIKIGYSCVQNEF